MIEEGWRELCRSVAEDDGLPAWEGVGHWTKQKLYFWYRYVNITTSAMMNHPAFPGGLVYVDLFGGAGICMLRGSGQRIPGSVLIAANTPKPFGKIIVCERDPVLADACDARLKKTLVGSRCRVLTGDCNQLIHQVVDLIPDRALTLAFVDPKGLDAEFPTIATLAGDRRVDIVALFADAYDINRNEARVYRKDPNSKLDRVLGPGSGWRERLAALPNHSGFNRRSLFAGIYIDQLKRHLRYTVSRRLTMKSKKGPLYSLIYVSKDKLGLKFWNEAVRKDESGQKGLF